MAGAEQSSDPSRQRPAAHDVRPYSAFAEHARATLAVLLRHFPFDRWTINHLVGDELVVEFSEPTPVPATRLAWSDSICARMVEHQGPCVAPRLADVPAYAAAPICRTQTIGAYAGVPLYDRAGKLWGTLAATHPSVLDTLPFDEEYLRWVARSLTTHLGPAAVVTSGRRPGPSTILGPELWEAVLRKEQERTARSGEATCIIEFDVAATTGDAADVEIAALVDRAAEVVAVAARGCDFVGRTADTRVALMAVNCAPGSAPSLMDRLLAELDEFGIHARAVILDHLHGTERVIDRPAEPPSAITYIVCGECRRKGAYVSPRFPMLRCKYCGGRHALEAEEWAAALHGTS